MNRQTADFIEAHRNDDIRRLALAGADRKDVDMPFALDQIAGRQTAQRKLPTWGSTDGIIYPPHISMEQCSSERTARYKAAVAGRIVAERHKETDRDTTAEHVAATTFADITGGFGVDFSFIAHHFDRATYIERQKHLCDIAKENFRLLGLGTAEVICGDGEAWLRDGHDKTSAPLDLIMADPARRDSHGGRTFAISDCTPDVLAMKPLLLAMAHHVMIKLSPMLDWHKAVEDLGQEVREVHIISTAGECKELLIIISRHTDGRPPRIYCADDETTVRFDMTELTSPAGLNNAASCGTSVAALSVTGSTDGELYLYEPNASIMKSGCFALIERRYGVRQIDTSSHLFISDRVVGDFPGRKFAVEAVTTMNKKELKRTLAGIGKACITTRNFPMTVAELRRRLKIKDGGDTYIFATTLPDRSHVLLICRKIAQANM